MANLFVSDIHLTPEKPELETTFLSFLGGPAGQAQALYILGDLFDTWLGDDDLAHPAWRSVIDGLAQVSAQGVELYFQHGNRDFLIGEAFARACGLTLLPEIAFVNLDGTSALLMHGDELCVDDQAYQAWRRQARDRQWQERFLALPIEERRAIAAGLRATSTREKAEKPPQIMDVNAAAVVAALRSAGVCHLIHGHTHRPAKHSIEVDARACERWVLPDWRPAGGYLECSNTGCAMHAWPEAK